MPDPRSKTGTPIPAPLVEFILLGPLDDRRQLQESPILGDVWVKFGMKPAAALDLLIEPYKNLHAGSVAAAIASELDDDDKSETANVAYLQGFVVADLTFEEVLTVVVPKTKWWLDKWVANKKDGAKRGTQKKAAKNKRKNGAPQHPLMQFTPAKIKDLLNTILDSATDWHRKLEQRRRLQEMPPFNRFVALAGLLLWAGHPRNSATGDLATGDSATGDSPRSGDQQIEYVLTKAKAEVDSICKLLGELAEKMLEDPESEPLVWQVSVNRVAMPALAKSIPAVKADAAKTLFKVNCSDIGWAVIDSGIDGTHSAFKASDGSLRVKRSFEFQNFRKIVSLSNSKELIRKKNAKLLLENSDSLVNKLKPAEAEDYLRKLAEDAQSQGPIHWELVEKFVEIEPTTPVLTNHGTHVAGILGASKDAAMNAAKGEDSDEYADGMCPDISLYDFRVLGPEIKDTEFAIIAAIQFIRYLNNRKSFLLIHGTNLSLSIPHDVRNFACGRTPICDECERLVDSGVVVVAAAGNHGYKQFETKDGSYDSYAAFSITDPGNADSVITVGATHRFWPHTYGVSFFSSRGPTGDGRLKPDLVAPGEKIRAPLRGNSGGGEWGDLDGTSMSAPHVSGAAAMLMARYSELIGHPRRIKQVLCDSATDLGRERSFQGRGMLDVLRAFQSI